MNKTLFLIFPMLMINFALCAGEYDIPLSPAAKTCIRNLIIQTYQDAWKELPAKYFVNYTDTIRLTCTEQDCLQAVQKELQELQDPSNNLKELRVKEVAHLQRTFTDHDTVLSYTLEITPEQRNMIFRCQGMIRHRSMKTK